MAVAAPEGLLYRPEFVEPHEERSLVDEFETWEFSEVKMRGQTARRTVVHFGYRYGYESWDLVATDPMPASLEWLRDRASVFADIDPAEVAETLVTRYPPGAGIGWHRDAPLFGSRVVGISLLSQCSMRFQRRDSTTSGPRRPGEREVFALELAPRSAYVLAGAARWSWQHSIPTTKSLRYSVTFRTLARRQAD